MITKIKNYSFAAVFISMGIWILSLRACDNISVIRNSTPIDTTVCEISSSPDDKKIYRIKGNFEFTGEYYRITEIKDRGGSRSENITGYLYSFSGIDSSCSILVNSEYPPEELVKVYGGENEIIIALKKFTDNEFRQIVTGKFQPRVSGSPGLITTAKMKNEQLKKPENGKTFKSITEKLFVSGYYGVISADIEDAKSSAKGSLAFDLFFSSIIIFFGIMFLVAAVKTEHG